MILSHEGLSASAPRTRTAGLAFNSASGAIADINVLALRRFGFRVRDIFSSLPARQNGTCRTP